MHAPYIVLRQNLAIRLVDKDAVCSDDIGAKHSDPFQVLHRRRPIVLLTVFPFFFHFRHVNQNRSMVLSRQSSRVLQGLLRAGINRMRSGRGMDQRIPLPFLQECFRVIQHGGFSFIVGRWEINKRLAQHTAHACCLGFFSDRVFEVIHVCERGHSRANLLGRCQPRSPAHELLINIFRFRRENIFVEPVAKGYIVVQSAK